MALTKSKQLLSGASGEYWKITNIVVDRINLKIAFIISLFTNKTYSDAKAPSLMNKTFNKSSTSEELLGDLPTVGYAYIKAQANIIMNKDFSGNTVKDYHKDEDLAGALDS